MARQVHVVTLSDQNGVYEVVAGETLHSTWEATAQVLLDAAAQAQQAGEADFNGALEQAKGELGRGEAAAAVSTLIAALQVQDRVFETMLPTPVGHRMVDVDDPKQVAQLLSAFVNRLGSGRAGQAFIEELLNDHRTLIQLKMGLFIRFIHAYAQEEGDDARNAASHALARKLDPIITEETGGYYRFPVI